MVRQTLHLFCHAVPGKRLQGLDNAGMQHPPALRQETAVGHLAGQDMLEGVRRLRRKARLV